MARYDHLPIWRDAVSLTTLLERAVRQFPRYHKYALGSDLRRQAYDVCRTVVAANAATAHRADAVERLCLLIEALKLWVQMGKALKAFANFNEFERAAEFAVARSKQSGGWRREKHPCGQSTELEPSVLRARHLRINFCLGLCRSLLAQPVLATERGPAQAFAQVPPHKRLKNAPPGVGLPIGNLSSQFFANVYLNELDQFVKHEIKCAHDVRDVDNFVLLHENREQLRGSDAVLPMQQLGGAAAALRRARSAYLRVRKNGYLKGVKAGRKRRVPAEFYRPPVATALSQPPEPNHDRKSRKSRNGANHA